MPLYEYDCLKCRQRFEVLVRGPQTIVCPSCGRASRVGYEFREDEKGRRVKVRVCKRDGCGEVLDR